MTGKKRAQGRRREIIDCDETDTSSFVDAARPLRFEDLDLRLPESPPTQVVSIRLPSRLLYEIRALSSQRDIPYQALIKLFLAKSVDENRRRGRKRVAGG